MIVASILIRKYEGSDATKHDNGETLQETTGALYEDECWRPCLKGIHPAWLLSFRILAFSMLLALLIIKVVIRGGGIYFYHTHLVVCSQSMDAISFLAPMIAGIWGYAFQIIYQRFPWFRIYYFVLWTAMFVIFQWIIHAFVSLRWPYPFLDLSSPYAPVWYLSVALLHIPCFAIFALVTKLKCYLLSRWFPQSYQCLK
ncbi:hypothetical protein AAC387_Pa05g3289 [Persea americana]